MVDERVVVVSGGSRGVGLAAARIFLAEGARVVITGRSAARLEEAAASLEAGDAVLALEADVTDEAAVASAFEAIDGRFGRVDVLVNNAGTAFIRKLVNTRLEEWRSVFDVHATGTFLMSRAAVKAMVAGGRGGAVVNVSSVTGRSGAAMGTAYSAAKAAVLGFTRALAKELAPQRITVNAVCPGAVDTAMFQKDTLDVLAGMYKRDREVLLKGTLAAIPLGRLMTADEVARMIAYLASEAGRIITGQTFTVDGGYDIH